MTADGHYSYTYDPENRLTQVEKPDPPTPDTLAQAVDSGLAFTTRGPGPLVASDGLTLLLRRGLRSERRHQRRR